MIFWVHLNRFLKRSNRIFGPTARIVQTKTQIQHGAQKILSFFVLPHSSLVLNQQISGFNRSHPSRRTIKLLCYTGSTFQLKCGV